ncbi:MAG TPA: fibronectin type III domain-containing protein [Gemmatimonadaceae bacterium]
MSLRSVTTRLTARDVGVRLLAAVVAIAVFSSCNDQGSRIHPLAPKGALRAVGSDGNPLAIEFFIQAHQDDWQLFFGDRAADAVATASKVVFVYTTAGSAAGSANTFYWQAREAAANASVDTLTLAAGGTWACGNATVNTHVIYRCTKANTVSYYLRLPNPGDTRPNGMSDLRDAVISSLSANDGSATYTSWSDLKTTLNGIIAAEIGTTPESGVGLHAPETDRHVNDSDHSDHLATGDLVDAASVGHDFNRFWYIGYQNQYEPQNVFGDRLAIKWSTVYAYDHVMVRLVGETIIGTSGAEVWVPRTIVRTQLAAGPPPPPPPPTAPNAPANLVVIDNGVNAINLTWTDGSSNEDGFNIERAPDAGGVAGTYEQIGSVGSNVTTYSNGGVNANVRYWYRVVAYNGVGASGYSNEANGILSTPNAPSGLITSPATGASINLSWTDNSADEQGFNIERAPDVGGVAGTYAQIASVGANVRTYSNTGLDVNVRYWYRVVAYNGVGASAYSNEASAILATPSAPSGLVATPAGTSMSLSWTDNSSDEQGFNIERAPDVGGVAGTYAQIASVGANVRTYTNTGLAANVRYWYRVVAFNSIGASGYSNEASGMATTPNPPSGLTATPVSGVRINLAWTDNSADEQGFRVERAPDVGGVAGTYALIATVGANVVAYNNTGLTMGTRYWYRVRAYNAVGNSNPAEATAITYNLPAAPTGLSATAAATAGRIDLAWTDNSTDEQGFRVERAPDAGGVPGTFAQITSVGVNVTTYANTGLANGTRYWYRIRAYNQAGTSAYTNNADATTPRPPAAPSNLNASPLSQNSVAVTWTDNSDNETSFRLDRAPNNAGVPGTYSQIATPGAGVTSYTNTGLTAGTSYWYRVRAQNAIGNSAYTAAVLVTTLPAVPPSDLAVRAYLVGTQRTADLTWTPGSEARVDVWRAGVKYRSNIVNTGANTATSGATLGNSVAYQVCIVNKTDAASCTAVVNANY